MGPLFQPYPVSRISSSRVSRECERLYETTLSYSPTKSHTCLPPAIRFIELALGVARSTDEREGNFGGNKTHIIMNNMLSTSKLEASPTTPSGSLARSRSRYKGAKSIKVVSTTQELPILGADHLNRLQKEVPSVSRRQPPNPPPPRSVEPLVKSRYEPLDKAKDCETVEDAARPRQTTHQELLPSNYGKDEHLADRPLTQAGSGDLGSYRPKTKQSGLKSEHERPQSQVRQMEERTALRRPPILSKKSFTQRITRSKDEDRLSKSRDELKRTISGPITTERHQRINTPAFDAPISAVNSGKREVAVKYGQSTMLLPVTPSTTPLDILRLASEHLRDSMISSNMTVVESYKQLSLERPLRRYEHIRDVLNSWDSDAENTLLIVPSLSDDGDKDLSLDRVARAQPGDTSVSIYHSQRPGHWDKRSVTLRSDGQILIAKKDGGETSNICHLSDFDIYVPNARQLSKKIRPPRKICFTVKSQQKSSMFMSTVNFVHFFSTSDRNLAASWYKAIQGWRSWYLVNVMGKGQPALQGSTKEIASAGHQASNDGEPRRGYHDNPSTASEDQSMSLAQGGPSKHVPARNRTAPPVSFPKKLSRDAEQDDSTARRNEADRPQTFPRMNPTLEPFIATSLLGRTYTQRQKAQQSREADHKRLVPQPPLPLANDEVNGLKRASSTRQMTKPLVDLTPQYREPPQHSRKGRGVVPEQLPAGGLVEIATSPEAVVEIPSATTWKKPIFNSGESGPAPAPEMQRSRTMNRSHSDGPSVVPRQTSTSPEKGNMPFTSGLLARNREGQGGNRTGRGVMTGDRQARAPMLDVTEESKYAHGSLLDRVESRDGGAGPVIEREKRKEMSTRTGEGM